MTAIYLHNFARPLAERAKARKHVGPYHWTPAKPGGGRGFYMGADGQPGDSIFRLRCEDANEHISGRLRFTSGYYCDRHCDGDTLQPIILRLPHGRGYLAGWTMGEGMASAVDLDIWADASDAAYEAHRMAERDAEKEREYQEQYEEDEE